MNTWRVSILLICSDGSASEGAFIDAMRADPNLYEDMVGERKVKIDGTSLMLTLMLIQELWNRERQTIEPKRVSKGARELHDKVVLFLESFTQVGFEIDQASDAYKVARDRLSTGRGNVIRQTEMLKELGAKTKKELREKSGIRALAEEGKRRSDGLHPSRKVMIDWDSHEFHPVVDMPEDYTILDLSKGTWTPPKTEYSIGKYDELRPGLYSTELFSGRAFSAYGNRYWRTDRDCLYGIYKWRNFSFWI